MAGSSLDFDAVSKRYAAPGWVMVRWGLFVPAGFIVAALTYVVTTVLNGFGSGLPSGIIWLFAAAISGGVGTLAASTVAPHLRAYAALAYVAVIAFGAIYSIGNALTAYDGQTPLWYAVLLLVIFLGSAIYGAMVSLTLTDEVTVWPRVSAGLRWALFFPAGLLAATMAFLAVLGLRMLLPNYIEIIDIEGRFLIGLAFLGVAIALAPAKRVVAPFLCAIYVLPAAISIVAGLLRPVIASLVEHSYGGHVGFYQPTWEFVLTNSAFLAAGLLPLVAVFRAKAPVSTAVESALVAEP